MKWLILFTVAVSTMSLTGKDCSVKQVKGKLPTCTPVAIPPEVPMPEPKLIKRNEIKDAKKDRKR